jgi:predicted metal-dependent phosphoesterase TrpH/predicted ATPase
MTADKVTPQVFQHGSTWLRADFHLHTRRDKEFKYLGEESYFETSYIEGLKKANIRVGVIANHNKFDLQEFKILQKLARKEGILLLPGIELSVKDGSNGVHVVVVFSDEWLNNKENANYIQSFINVAFATQGSFENENSRSNHDLLDTIRELNNFERNYFFVFAHVEEKNGLWGGLAGGRIRDFGEDELFRSRTLGFQKVRTRTKQEQVHEWLRDWYPAEVEGSDCKSIEHIGQGKACYLKIGDFTFEAVKYALLDYPNRVASEAKRHERSHILSATFEGGILQGRTIFFSPELNTLIGIRGSGKSSVLEAIRYALDIHFGDKTLDRDYKKALVGHTLGSGGKVTLQAVDERGQRYEIRRINLEKPDVYVGGLVQPGVSIRETVLCKPIYFGQKDLSSTGDGFEKDLVEKLVGEKLREIRADIESQKQKVIEAVRDLKRLTNTEEKKKEYKAKQQDAEHRLKFYKDHGVEEKLQKQVDFDADSRKCSQIVSVIKGYLCELEAFVNRYEADLKNQRAYKSRQNEQFFREVLLIYDELIVAFTKIKEASVSTKMTFARLHAKTKEFEVSREGLKEEFAEIERKLAVELKDSGAKAIRPDEFRQLRTIVEQSKQMLEALEKEESQRVEINQKLLTELARLNDFWHAEFRGINEELDKVNRTNSSLAIKVEFKADKVAFVDSMKDLFRGSRMRESTFTALADSFTDFGAMYKDFQKAKETTANSGQAFEDYFNRDLETLLTWQIPNRFVIEYRGKELRHHSLGQRASALILFVLSQRENDVIIIDQPEDDLDNQTIYEDVIKLIRTLKPTTQFIFATHNANFPVLGDAEQVISCGYSDEAMTVTSGSIDSPELQQAIVDIMEGGEEAFSQRKRIYEIWKPQKS